MSGPFPRSDFAVAQAELDALVASAGPKAFFVMVTEAQHRNIIGGNVKVPTGWAHSAPDRLSRKRPQAPYARGYHGPCRGPQ